MYYFRRENRNLVLLFGITPLLLLSFVFVFFSVLLKFLSIETNDQNNEDNLYDYKYLTYDPRRNETNKGFVSSFTFLGENECISRIDESGIHHLISRIEENEYKCVGSCFCDETETNFRRTSTTGIISRNLIYLVSAVSTFIAFDLARKHFEEECETELSSVCKSGHGVVRSEVNDCFNPNKGHELWREPHRTYIDEVNVGESKEDREHKYYRCQGSCVPRVSSSSYLRTLSKDFNCEKLEVCGCVVVNDSPVGYDEQAKIEFQLEWLKTYCRRASTIEMQLRSEERNVFLCVSGYNNYFNPTVECRDVYSTFDEVYEDDDEDIDPDTIPIDDLELFGDEDELQYEIDDIHTKKF